MLRIRGDRASLLAALAAHWAEQQLLLPGRSDAPERLTPLPPLRSRDRDRAR